MSTIVSLVRPFLASLSVGVDFPSIEFFGVTSDFNEFQ